MGSVYRLPVRPLLFVNFASGTARGCCQSTPEACQGDTATSGDRPVLRHGDPLPSIEGAEKEKEVPAFGIAMDPALIAQDYLSASDGNTEGATLTPASVYLPRNLTVARASNVTGTHMLPN